MRHSHVAPLLITLSSYVALAVGNVGPHLGDQNKVCCKCLVFSCCFTMFLYVLFSGTTCIPASTGKYSPKYSPQGFTRQHVLCKNQLNLLKPQVKGFFCPIMLHASPKTRADSVKTLFTVPHRMVAWHRPLTFSNVALKPEQ